MDVVVTTNIVSINFFLTFEYNLMRVMPNCLYM